MFGPLWTVGIPAGPVRRGCRRATTRTSRSVTLTGDPAHDLGSLTQDLPLLEGQPGQYPGQPLVFRSPLLGDDAVAGGRRGQQNLPPVSRLVSTEIWFWVSSPTGRAWRCLRLSRLMASPSMAARAAGAIRLDMTAIRSVTMFSLANKHG